MRFATALTALSENRQGEAVPTPADISRVIQQELTSIDNLLRDDLLNLFPGGEEQLEGMSDKDFQDLATKWKTDGPDHTREVVSCVRGSTVVLALIDPPFENLWVANLGNSFASTCFDVRIHI